MYHSVIHSRSIYSPDFVFCLDNQKSHVYDYIQKPPRIPAPVKYYHYGYGPAARRTRRL